MCEVYHIPLAVTQRHGMWTPKMPANDSAKLLEAADALAGVLCGCPALCIPTEEREAFLADVQALLEKREQRKAQGFAS
jgi:hypothetical protein